MLWCNENTSNDIFMVYFILLLYGKSMGCLLGLFVCACVLCESEIYSHMSGVYGIRLNQTDTGVCVFRVLDFIFNEHMRPHI